MRSDTDNESGNRDMLDGNGGAPVQGARATPPGAPVQLGDVLLQRGLIDEEQLTEALAQQRADGSLLGEILLQHGWVEETELARALAEIAGVPFEEIDLDAVEGGAVHAVPRELPPRHRLMPLALRNGSIRVAFADPLDILALDEVSRRTGLLVEQVCATEGDIRRAVDHFYGGAGVLEGLVTESLERQRAERQRAERGGLVVTEAEPADGEPMVRLVDELINQGVRRRATDIHVEPEDRAVRVRFRVDGSLQPGPMLPKRIQDPLVSRVKVIAGLDIAEQRLPQEGHITYEAMGHEVDLRVSCFPTVFGEKVALRLLERNLLFHGMEQLGLEGDTLARLEDCLTHTKGIVLLTGPTGSGKTTTLYTMMSRLDALAHNIVTLEDPVEYRIPQIRQSQINVKAGFDFARGLRSILRQDPDVIMVGEIRDPETAGLAMRAALTGILVFSTLHTNEAAGTFPRLIDMGMEPYLIASTLVASAAERLVRVVCKRCAEPTGPDLDMLASLGLQDEELGGEWLRGQGCRYCSDSGYIGRTGIFEVMLVSRRIRDLVQQRADTQTVRQAAIEEGMETLLQHGLRRVRRGETTLEELARVAKE